MAVHWCGYMSGAVEAGYHAAAEVMQEMDGDKLQEKDWALLEDFKPRKSTGYKDVVRQRSVRRGARGNCTVS